ncbi:MAG TPA: tRNA pseudouridine(55) synthase TruB [Bacteroidota bacterium]
MKPTEGGRDFQVEGEMLLVDKPLDWTSFDVVKKIRSLFNVKKVGHAGTLDPKASGLLIVCTGKRTKSLESFLNAEKEYTGTFELGVRTPSFDSETAVTETSPYTDVTPVVLEQAVQKFRGKVLQVPPMYSAAKKDGRPLYSYARDGVNVERSAKEIEIVDFRITRFAPPMAKFRVVCSKGTYIRSLIDDLGNELGCGCTLRSLRRIRIGSYTVEHAMTIQDLVTLRQTLESRHRQHDEVGQPA